MWLALRMQSLNSPQCKVKLGDRWIDDEYNFSLYTIPPNLSLALSPGSFSRLDIRQCVFLSLAHKSLFIQNRMCFTLNTIEGDSLLTISKHRFSLKSLYGEICWLLHYADRNLVFVVPLWFAIWLTNSHLRVALALMLDLHEVVMGASILLNYGLWHPRSHQTWCERGCLSPSRQHDINEADNTV